LHLPALVAGAVVGDGQFEFQRVHNFFGGASSASSILF
jgi:hypothetical protein